MYRPPSRPPKGAWARHLHEQRQRRDLSQTQAFELVYERIGWSPKSRTAYVAIDMGDRLPKGEEVTVLGAEFGWPPDPLEEPTPPDQAGLVAVLAKQSEAIDRLAEQLSRMTHEAAGRQRELTRLVALVAHLVGADAPQILDALREPPVPPEADYNHGEGSLA